MTKSKELTDHASSAGADTGNELILFNDDVNSFDFVIECLIEICNHEFEQAEQCTLIAHFKGKCGIKVGSYSDLEPLQTGLSDRGLSTIIV